MKVFVTFKFVWYLIVVNMVYDPKMERRIKQFTFSMYTFKFVRYFIAVNMVYDPKMERRIKQFTFSM